MVVVTSHAQNSTFKHTLLILWGAPNSGNLQLGIVLWLQVESGGVLGLWASSLRVRVSGLEGSG